MTKPAKRIRGDVPKHRANTAAMRRLERRMRGPVNAPEAINAKQLEIKSGYRFHPTKGWKRDRFYRQGDPARPTHMEMLAVFWATIERAQKSARNQFLAKELAR